MEKTEKFRVNSYLCMKFWICFFLMQSKQTPQYHLIYVLILFCSLMSCSKKADVVQLFKNSSGNVELDFEYAQTSNGTFSSLSDGKSYHLFYDRISQTFHIWSNRVAYIQFDINGEFRGNNFFTDDNQVCFQSDGRRIIIENSGNDYIVRYYRFNEGGNPGHWDSGTWVSEFVLFNSEDIPSDLNKHEEVREDNMSISNEEPVVEEDEEEYVQDPDEIERKAQTFLEQYRDKSKNECFFGRYTHKGVVMVFPVNVGNYKASEEFYITFNEHDYNRRKKELKLDDLVGAGDYVVYKGELYDTNCLEINEGIVKYTCVPHTFYTDM